MSERDKNKAEIDKLIDEIKIMREEINWRVKLSYSGHIIFVTIFSLIVSYFLRDKGVELTDQDFTIIGLCTTILIAIYTGILNANHLIEKKNEHYIFHLQKKICQLEGNPSYCWLSFMYGHKFSKKSIVKVLSFLSDITFGLFQYGLPIVIAIYVLFHLATKYHAHYTYTLFFVSACIFVFLTSISSIFLLTFLLGMIKEQKKFYNCHVSPYLNQK